VDGCFRDNLEKISEFGGKLYNRVHLQRAYTRLWTLTKILNELLLECTIIPSTNEKSIRKKSLTRKKWSSAGKDPPLMRELRLLDHLWLSRTMWTKYKGLARFLSFFCLPLRFSTATVYQTWTWSINGPRTRARVRGRLSQLARSKKLTIDKPINCPLSR